MKLLTHAALIAAVAGLAVACGRAETSGDSPEPAPADAPATAPAHTGKSPAPADTGGAAAATELRIAVEGMT